jgi:hypothetical protein
MGTEQTFVKVPDGKSLFITLYGMYSVTLSELTVSAQAEQSGAVNKT